MLKAARDAVVLADADTGVILDLNWRAEELFGRPKDTLGGRHHTELYPEEAIQQAASGLSELVRQLGDYSTETVILHASGRHVPVEVSKSIAIIETRRVAVVLFRDISERKELDRHRITCEALIRQRTADLEAQKAELESFNKAMLGREMRIIELKEEVNALCRELGREPQYPPVWLEGKSTGRTLIATPPAGPSKGEVT